MPKGEFENRDRDESSDFDGIPLAGGGLGELSEDLANERGDLATYSLRAAENMAPDMARAAAARIDAAETGLGSPSIDYTVRSIYDSRPSNHREFNLWFERIIGAHADPDSMLWARKCFFVPAGYVAVLRSATVIVKAAASLSNYDGLLEFLVNGATYDPMQVTVGPGVGPGAGVSTPDQIMIPWRSNAPVSTFIIADENDSIGLNLSFAPGITSPITQSELQIGFYGQFLLKTGVPAQFQPANEAGRAKTAVTSSRNDLAIQSSDGIMAKSRRRIPFANVPILRNPKK